MADELSGLLGDVVEARKLLAAIPDGGRHWYIEDARPGHEDEARVYGGGCWGIAKPTSNNPSYRRPIAEFIVAAPRLLCSFIDAVERESLKAQELDLVKGAMAAQDERERVRAVERSLDGLASELMRAAPMEITFRPITVFQIVGLLQLALRHPNVSPEITAAARTFIYAATLHFEQCPTVLDVIRRGDDPREDR